MTAQELRDAAALMRARAEADLITPGPWGFAGVSGQGFAVHHGEHDTVALYANRPGAAHIASWHPAAALAVADWLDTVARLMDGGDPGGPLLQGRPSSSPHLPRRHPVTAFLTLPAATLAQVNAPTLAQAYAADVIFADLADDIYYARPVAESDYGRCGRAAVAFVRIAEARLTAAGVR